MPALRAFESPTAIACFFDIRPCFCERLWCISSRTYAPACVDALSPRRLALLAARFVAASGMAFLAVIQGAQVDIDVEVGSGRVFNVSPDGSQNLIPGGCFDFAMGFHGQLRGWRHSFSPGRYLPGS